MVDVTCGFMGFWGLRRVLGEVTEVLVLNILIGVDSKVFFHNFCDGGRFLKELKQEKGLN